VDATIGADKVAEGRERILTELRKVIVGQDEIVEQVLIALFTGGHCLITGVPGLAKTLLISSLAKSLHLSFKRIQFTPDLMPSDVTGTEVIQEDPETRQRAYRFLPGPIFANMLLADEINRTTPKTQSALLEAMAERQVTVEGATHNLPAPFIVLATQNPIEHHGTYPLPESQLDRFMLRLRIGYPAAADEELILREREFADPLDSLEAVMTAHEVSELQRIVATVSVDDSLVQYLMRIVAATRDSEMLDLGVSPRGTLALFRAAQALALTEERTYCIPDDFKRLVVPVFAHRIVVSSRFASSLRRSEEAEAVLNELLKTVSVPL